MFRFKFWHIFLVGGIITNFDVSYSEIPSKADTMISTPMFLSKGSCKLVEKWYDYDTGEGSSRMKVTELEYINIKNKIKTKLTKCDNEQVDQYKQLIKKYLNINAGDEISKTDTCTIMSGIKNNGQIAIIQINIKYSSQRVLNKVILLKIKQGKDIESIYANKIDFVDSTINAICDTNNDGFLDLITQDCREGGCQLSRFDVSKGSITSPDVFVSSGGD